MGIALRLAAAVSAGALALCAWLPPGAVTPMAQAAEPIAFTIPAEDGYGIADCMTAASLCGQEIADAWCVEHGRTRAVAFGAADITGEIPREGRPPAAPGTVVIRCD